MRYVLLTAFDLDAATNEKNNDSELLSKFVGVSNSCKRPSSSTSILS